jgi:uracil-DNA glycosylase family 4
MGKCNPIGPDQADVMILAEHPDTFEANTGRSFEGKSSQFLKSLMYQVGMNPASVHMTYLHKSKPERGNLGWMFDRKTGVPNGELLASLMELMDEVKQVNPKVIIPLGSYALWATTKGCARWHKEIKDGEPVGYTGIDDWRGSIIAGAVAATGRKIVPAYNHARVFSNYPSRVYTSLDLKRGWEQRLYPDIRRPDYRIEIYPQADLAEWERKLLSADIIFFDIEYIGKDWLCISFCVDDESVLVLPTETEANRLWAKRILESGVPLGAQNGMFDCSVLEWHYSFRLFENFKYDTMLASHAAYIELPKDLGTLCSIYTEQPCYWTHIDWKAIAAGIQPISDVYAYNGIDSWVTRQVAMRQQADELLDPAVRKTFDFEMSLIEPLWNMSKRGVLIDQGKMSALREQCELAIREKSKVLSQFTGIADFNVASPPQVANLLFTQLGLKPRGQNKKLPKTDDKTLAEIALTASTPEQKAILKLIREIRTERSLISKFCNIRLGHDGRMRSHYNPGGTNTGRLASKQFYPTGEGANGQNHPRDKRVRDVFVPDPGRIFFYNDLERAESLVVAYLTGDPLMLEHHGPGKDAHALLAMELFECSFEEAMDKDKRYMGKQTRHAGNYMEGWRTFQINVNKLAEATGVAITAAEAKFFIQRYRDLHPYLSSWWRWTEMEIRDRGKLYTLLGRPRQFFDRFDTSLPAGVAFVPQGTVGDVLNTGLVRCYHDRELNDMGTELLMQVHDAIGGQTLAANILPAMERIEKHMRVDLQIPLSMNCPTAGAEFSIPVEIAFGPSWARVKKHIWEGAAA